MKRTVAVVALLFGGCGEDVWNVNDYEWSVSENAAARVENCGRLDALLGDERLQLRIPETMDKAEGLSDERMFVSYTEGEAAEVIRMPNEAVRCDTDQRCTETINIEWDRTSTDVDIEQRGHIELEGRIIVILRDGGGIFCEDVGAFTWTGVRR